MPHSRFDPAVLANDPIRRQAILDVLDAALDAVDPAAAVKNALQRQGRVLLAGDISYDLRRFRRVYILGFGKAATPMARAALDVLGEEITAGALITKVGHGPIQGQSLFPLAVFEAGHPMPDDAGVTAARHVANLAKQAAADDLVICLISGGGSALLTSPAEGVSLADLQATTAALLRCGAAIDEINTLRKHLSGVKGGQLARLAAPAAMLALVLSDVVGSPLDVIASGPTVADSSTWADAWAIVRKYELVDALPPAVIARLRAGLAGELADTPKSDDPAFIRTQTLIIADNARAAKAAEIRATRLGFNALILSTFVEGEAREMAKLAVALAREIAAENRPAAAPACLILGGETTVTLRGDGKGGRNQELALAAGLALDQSPDSKHIIIVSLATDGTDGPTDSAGALADAETVARGRALGLDAADHLRRNDAYPFLHVVGDMLRTGPTQTNVNDLIFVFVFSDA